MIVLAIFRQEVKMRIAVFGAKNYERRLLDELNPRHKHEIVYFEPLLDPNTAVLAAEAAGAQPISGSASPLQASRAHKQLQCQRFVVPHKFRRVLLSPLRRQALGRAIKWNVLPRRVLKGEKPANLPIV
jgi:hypothetical protein